MKTTTDIIWNDFVKETMEEIPEDSLQYRDMKVAFFSGLIYGSTLKQAHVKVAVDFLIEQMPEDGESNESEDRKDDKKGS